MGVQSDVQAKEGHKGRKHAQIVMWETDRAATGGTHIEAVETVTSERCAVKGQ